MDKRRKEGRNGGRPSRGMRAQLVPKRVPGQRSPIRKEILHRVPSGNSLPIPNQMTAATAARKLVFDNVPESARDRPKTAVEEISDDGDITDERTALFGTVQRMLTERGGSVQSDDAGHGQDEILNQLDMLDAVLLQGIRNVERGRSRFPEDDDDDDDDDEESIRATRLEQQRHILREIKQQLRSQFVSQKDCVAQLQFSQCQVIDQLDATSKSLSAYVNENESLREQMDREGEVKMNLQKTISEKSRQVEGLMTHLHDLRHELSSNQSVDSKPTEATIEENAVLKERLAECGAKVKLAEAKYSAMKKKADRKEEQLIQIVMDHGREVESGESLTQKLQEMTEEAGKWKESCARKTRQIEELSREKKCLQMNVERWLSDNHRVSEALRNADAKNTELALSNESLQDAVEQCVLRGSKWEKKVGLLSEEVNKLKSERDELVMEINEEDARHQKKAKAFSQEVGLLKGQLDQSGAEVEELKQQVEAVERLVTHRTQQQMQNLTGQLVKKSRAVEQLKQSHTLLKERLKLVESDNEELKAALEESSLNVTQLNSALDKIQLELVKVHDKSSTLSEQVSKLNTTLSTMEDAEIHRNANISVIPRTWSISSDLSTVSFKQLDTSVASDVSQRFTEKIDGLQQRCDKQSEILKRRENELANLKKSYKLLAKAKDKVTRVLLDKDGEVVALKSQLGESLATIQQETGRRDEELSQLRHQMSEQENGYRSLKDVMDGMAEENQQLKAALERSNRQVETASRKAEGLSDVVRMKEKAVYEKERRNGKLTEEHDALMAEKKGMAEEKKKVFEMEKSRLRGLLDRAVGESERARNQMKDMIGREEFLQEVDELKSLLGTVNEEKDELSKLLAQRDDEVGRLDEQVVSLREQQRVELEAMEGRHKREVTAFSEATQRQRRQVVAEVKSLQKVAQNEIQRVVRVLGKEKEDAVAQLQKRHDGETDSTQAEASRLAAERDELLSVVRRIETEWLSYSETCLRRIEETETELIANEEVRVDRVAGQCRSVAATLHEVTVANEAARNTLTRKDERVRRLAAEVETLRERKEALRDKQEATLREKCDALSRKLAGAISVADGRSDVSESALNSLYEQLGNCTRQLRHLESEIGRQEKEKRMEVESLRMANERLMKENVALKNARAKLTSANVALKASNEEMMKEHKEFETKLKELGARCEHLARVNGELKRKVEELRGGGGAVGASGFTAKMRSLEAENTELKRNVDRLLQHNVRLTEGRDSLEVEVRRLRNSSQSPSPWISSTPKSGDRSLESIALAAENKRLQKVSEEQKLSLKRMQVKQDKVKERLKGKRRLANYLRLRLGGLISEQRHLKRA